MERTTRMLYGVAAVFLLLGLGLRIVPAPADPGEASPAGSRPVPSPSEASKAAGELPGITAAIAEGNIFSPTRSAPTVRFTPPDLSPPAEEQRPARRGPRSRRLRLFGTVVGPSSTAALIDADPVIRGAEIYQVGELVAGRRLIAVSESTAVLAGAAGRMVLRLHPTSPRTR
jgi:hypothetical protein